MMRWKTAPDLGGVRDSEALAKLSEAGHKEWRSLWADVESLLKRGRKDTHYDASPFPAGQ